MFSEKEYQLEAMSFKDMASLVLPAPQLDALMHALKDQEATIQISASENHSLLESFEELHENDPKLAFVFVKEIGRLITTRSFHPEDIPKLIHQISYSPRMAQGIQEKYEKRGAMSWTEFGISIHDAALVTKPDGSPRHNIGQFFDHEISHSLIESGSVTPDAIDDLLHNLDVSFESSHVQSLIKKGADEDLIKKERFCEISSCYLQSASDPDRKLGFLNRMMNNSAKKHLNAEDSDEARAMFEHYQIIFNRIEQLWPTISGNLNNITFEEIYEESINGQEFDLDMETEEHLEPTPESPNASIQSGDSGSDKAPKDIKPRTFEETPELAREDKSESFAKASEYFLRDFANALDIFSNGMAA